MSKAFEKILERLILESSSCKVYKLINPNKEDIAEFNAYKKCIEIVQEVVEEFATDTNVGTNGWIACSEKLPELRQDVLVTVKYTGFMGMHGYWIKTGHMEAENDWWGDCAGGDVIAWQPLPEPFKERD